MKNEAGTAMFGVYVQETGKKGQVALVGSGATVRSALRAVKIDAETKAGQITLNGKKADLSDRLKTNDLLAITPNVAGGVR